MNDKVQPGDVFVVQRGETEHIQVVLPDTEWTAKVPFIRLNGSSGDSTYTRLRSRWGSHQRRWRFVGTVPAYYLDYLWRNWTLR